MFPKPLGLWLSLLSLGWRGEGRRLRAEGLKKGEGKARGKARV